MRLPTRHPLPKLFFFLSTHPPTSLFLLKLPELLLARAILAEARGALGVDALGLGHLGAGGALVLSLLVLGARHGTLEILSLLGGGFLVGSAADGGGALHL